MLKYSLSSVSGSHIGWAWPSSAQACSLYFWAVPFVNFNSKSSQGDGHGIHWKFRTFFYRPHYKRIPSSNNKSPGLDGLTYEFFKKTWSIINELFFKVLQCQLDRLRLIDSDKVGATRLLSKVNGIPRVDELRPITLLNCDYRILSKIMVLRLKPTLPHIVRSGQLCTVGGKNIISCLA